MRNIVESVRLPHARRWFEGLLRLLVANNRAFCPREAKMNDYSQTRMILPVRGGSGLVKAVACKMLRELRRRLLLCAGVCFCALACAFVRWRLLL